jgi:citronellol/citronellal dehydrogenase
VLEDAKRELAATGVPVEMVPADLSNEEDVARVVATTLERFGRCDILVNNAAVSFVGPFLEVPARRWRPVFAVNLLAPVMLAQGFLPGMIERGGGSIVNVSTGAVLERDPGATTSAVHQLPYATTKAGLERLTLGLAAQFAAASVNVNCLRIDETVGTEATEWHLANSPHSYRSPSTSDDVGRAIAWLAMQPPSFTGRVLGMEEMRALGAL